MEKRKKEIMKASVCLAIFVAMVMPSVVADMKQRVLLPVVMQGTVVVAGDESNDGSSRSIIVSGLVCGVTRHVVFGMNTESFSYIPGGVPPDVDSGACGLIEGLNHVGYASSFPWVHTYNPNIQPPICVMMIYAPLFVCEYRHNRTKAYIAVPGIEYKQDIQDDTWSGCPMLGGALVWENMVVNYTYAGSFCFGKGNIDDHVYRFRAKLTFWDESARGTRPDGSIWVRFDEGVTVNSETGFWFSDQYPYTSDAEGRGYLNIGRNIYI